MKKRAFRIFKAQVNSLLEKLEQPEKILQQISRDGRKAIYELYVVEGKIAEEISQLKSAIEEAKKNDVSENLISSLEESLEKQKAYQDKLSKQIEEYAAKVKDAEGKISALQSQAQVLRSMLKIKKNMSTFDFDSDFSALNRMEEKINGMQIQLDALDKVEELFM